MLASASLKISIWTLSRPSVRVVIWRSALAHIDLAEIADPNLPALAEGDDGIADLFEVGVLVEGAHHVLGATLAEGAAGDVDVLLGEPVDDVFSAQPRVPETVGVEQDVDLLLEPAAHPNRGHPLDGFEGAFDLKLGEAAQPAQPLLAFELDPVAGETELEHRVEGRVESQDQRALGLGRAERPDRASPGCPGWPRSSRRPS